MRGVNDESCYVLNTGGGTMHRMRTVIPLTGFLVLGVLTMIHDARAETPTGRLPPGWSPSAPAVAHGNSASGAETSGMPRTASGGPFAYSTSKTGALSAADEFRAFLPIVMLDPCPPVSFTTAV